MKKILRSDIFGMARVGYVSNKYEIYVNTNDAGSIPHFHYRDSTDWDKFHTCICIESATYFIHGNKQDTLNSKQKQQLQEFMQSKVQLSKYADKFTNNWELVCFLWDMNNSSTTISDDVSMPNYDKEITL